MGLFTKEWITFRKPFQNVIRPFPDLKAWFYPLWTQSSFKSGIWNALLKCGKKGVLDRDPRRMQSSFGMWFERAHFGNARWSHAWVNLHSRNKILPRSAQILFVIGTVFAMHVNAHSSNHASNQEADLDPKRLLEHDSFLCEQSQYFRNYIILQDKQELIIKLDKVCCSQEEQKLVCKQSPQKLQKMSLDIDPNTVYLCKLLPVSGTAIKITSGEFCHCDWPASLCVHDACSVCLIMVYCIRGYFRGGFIFANFASQTSQKFPLQFMSIYSNENRRKSRN